MLAIGTPLPIEPFVPGKRLPLPHETLGERLRARRLEQGLSARELARRLGVTPSAISKIEKGACLPSVSMLWAMVSELGLSLDELFSTAAASAPGDQRDPDEAAEEHEGVARSGEQVGLMRGHGAKQERGSRKAIELESGVRWERLTGDTDPLVDFIYVTYAVGGCSSVNGLFVRHAGREYGVVLSGRLEVTVGFETYVLEAGDSISFESTTPHLLRNVGDEPVTGIWAVVGRHERDPRTGAFDEA